MARFLSPDYGGASAAIVHQDRLVLAGSGIVGDLFLASRVGDWEDFRLGVVTRAGSSVSEPVYDVASQVRPQDDFARTDADGFFAQSTSGRGNEFQGLVQQEGLFVFGSLGESVVPPGAFTADAVQLRENSWYGSDLGRTPIIAGGLVVFLQAGGEDLRGITWTEAERKYVAPSLLSIAGDVFTRARDMTFQPSDARHGDTVFVLAEDGDEDGNLAVMLVQVGQNPAWSHWDTPGGAIVSGAGPLGEMAFAVERNGVVALETLHPDPGAQDFDQWTEQVNAGDEPLAAATDGLDTAYEGDWIWDDGVEQGEGPLSQLPMIEAGRTLRIGRRFDRIVETMPFVRQGASGLARSLRRTRIFDVALDCVVRRRTEDLTDEERARLDRLLESARLVQVLVIAEQSGRRQERRQRSRTRRLSPASRDTQDIVRIVYGAVPGWRDRIALRFTCDRHVEIAGVAYKAVG